MAAAEALPHWMVRVLCFRGHIVEQKVYNLYYNACMRVSAEQGKLISGGHPEVERVERVYALSNFNAVASSSSAA